MPNVNLLPTINTATNNNSYFVVSDNGFVRRFKYSNLVAQIQQTVPDANRTDQDLFTTTDVTFSSVNLIDRAAAFGTIEHFHGFQSSAAHADGSGLKRTDIIGSIRFGGYDGTSDTIQDQELSTAGMSAIALEDWAHSNGVTTESGTGMNLFMQPVNTRLSARSKSTFLSAITTATGPTSLPITVLRIGSVLPAETPFNYVSTSSDGSTNFVSKGRAEVVFPSSRIFQSGVPAEDNDPINPTVLGTNVFTFLSSRHTPYQGGSRTIRNGDTLGQINFRGLSTTTNAQGALTALIRAHATTDYASDRQGAGLHFRAASSSTNQLVTVLDLQPESSFYFSDSHTFRNQFGDGPNLAIVNGTILFGDNSVQSTAYQGFVSPPTSSISEGIQGQMAYDSTYFYICVAPNQWKRIAASDF